MPEELKKRIWCYCGSPKNFLIPVHTCGAEPQWSEFEGHCWCPQCQIDYKPEDNGIFDGPILLEVTNLCGIVFDRFIIETGEVQLQNDWITSTGSGPSAAEEALRQSEQPSGLIKNI